MITDAHELRAVQGACAGATPRALATAREVAVQGAVHAEGDLGFRGTLGVAKDAPVGFRAARPTLSGPPELSMEVT